MPRRKSAPVTDILLWLQCYAALVGVLFREYPTMVPEFTSYQAMIIKCLHDFQGPARGVFYSMIGHYDLINFSLKYYHTLQAHKHGLEPSTLDRVLQ
jgi:hypothetical protein